MMEKIVDTFFVYLKKIIPASVFTHLHPFYHFLLAFWAALFYGFPSRRIKVIGITGTKGKTTVIELAHKILEEAGFKIASMSSLRFNIGGQEEINKFKMTMPGRMFIQKFLHRAVKSGCQYAILEVTSEGIKQFRHRFINFKTAALTNVSLEHLEAHGGFEKYLRAKLDLFWRMTQGSTVIINRDDPKFKRFLAASAAPKIFYGKDGIEIGEKTFAVRHVSINEKGIEAEINGIAISSSLLGEFNFYNILAAVALGLSEHISLEKIAATIARIGGVSGRMEFVQKEPFTVVVDYAHTPDSLKKVYTFFSAYSAKLKNQNSKLICVLGAAGGGRDKWKRPEFGKIAAEYCDEVILTNEDPYDENPQDIINQIESGFSRNTKYRAQNVKKILDRREAIREALRSAKAGDVLIITGKGAESWIVGSRGKKIPWDDRGLVREELSKLGK